MHWQKGLRIKSQNKEIMSDIHVHKWILKYYWKVNSLPTYHTWIMKKDDYGLIHSTSISLSNLGVPSCKAKRIPKSLATSVPKKGFKPGLENRP